MTRAGRPWLPVARPESPLARIRSRPVRGCASRRGHVLPRAGGPSPGPRRAPRRWVRPRSSIGAQPAFRRRVQPASWVRLSSHSAAKVKTLSGHMDVMTSCASMSPLRDRATGRGHGMPLPDVVVNRSSPVPLYFQVAEQLERAILDGSLSPGDRIANEVTLAGELGLSRPTMRQAIQLLVDKGMLVRKRGVGTQVVHGKVRRSLELTSLYDDLVQAGEKPRTEILELGRQPADQDVASELQVEVGDVVWSLERLRYIGDEPLALMHNYLPLSVLDLAAVDLETCGLYASLRSAGVLMRVAKQ